MEKFDELLPNELIPAFLDDLHRHGIITYDLCFSNPWGDSRHYATFRVKGLKNWLFGVDTMYGLTEDDIKMYGYNLICWCQVEKDIDKFKPSRSCFVKKIGLFNKCEVECALRNSTEYNKNEREDFFDICYFERMVKDIFKHEKKCHYISTCSKDDWLFDGEIKIFIRILFWKICELVKSIDGKLAYYRLRRLFKLGLFTGSFYRAKWIEDWQRQENVKNAHSKLSKIKDWEQRQSDDIVIQLDSKKHKLGNLIVALMRRTVRKRYLILPDEYNGIEIAENNLDWKLLTRKITPKEYEQRYEEYYKKEECINEQSRV